MTDSDSSPSNRFGSYTARDALGPLKTLLLIAVVVPFVIYAVPQVVGAEQSYVVMSGSMEPTIGTGDVVVVNDVPASAVEQGDVITYGGSVTEPPTTHRVIAVEGSGAERVFRTKGDNNEDPDPSPVPAAELRGKVMELPVSVPGADHSLFVIPLIGRVILFAQTTVGFVVLILAPFVLLTGSELLTFVRSLREEDGATDDRTAGGSTAGREADHGDGGRATADDGEGFTVSTRMLTIAVGVLAAVGTFTAQRASETRDPLMATVAAGAIAGCLLIVLLLLFGSGEDAAAPADPGPTTADRVRTDGAPVSVTEDVSTDRVLTGRLPSTLSEWPRVEVDSPQVLAEMAAQRGTCVVHDVETETYALFDAGVVHTADASTAADAPGDADVADGDDEPPADASTPSDTSGDQGGDRR